MIRKYRVKFSASEGLISSRNFVTLKGAKNFQKYFHDARVSSYRYGTLTDACLWWEIMRFNKRTGRYQYVATGGGSRYISRLLIIKALRQHRKDQQQWGRK